MKARRRVSDDDRKAKFYRQDSRCRRPKEKRAGRCFFRPGFDLSYRFHHSARLIKPGGHPSCQSLSPSAAGRADDDASRRPFEPRRSGRASLRHRREKGPGRGRTFADIDHQPADRFAHSTTSGRHILHFHSGSDDHYRLSGAYTSETKAERDTKFMLTIQPFPPLTNWNPNRPLRERERPRERASRLSRCRGFRARRNHSSTIDECFFFFLLAH